MLQFPSTQDTFYGIRRIFRCARTTVFIVVFLISIQHERAPVIIVRFMDSLIYTLFRVLVGINTVLTPADLRLVPPLYNAVSVAQKDSQEFYEGTFPIIL